MWIKKSIDNLKDKTIAVYITITAKQIFSHSKLLCSHSSLTTNSNKQASMIDKTNRIWPSFCNGAVHTSPKNKFFLMSNELILCYWPSVKTAARLPSFWKKTFLNQVCSMYLALIPIMKSINTFIKCIYVIKVHSFMPKILWLLSKVYWTPYSFSVLLVSKNSMSSYVWPENIK